MTTPSSNQPVRAGAVQRYGPLAGIALAIVVVAGMVTVAGRGGADPVAAGTTANASAIPSDMPVSYEQAKAAGKEGATTWVDNCDKATGRVKMPTVYAFPCVPKFSGSNGGATGAGVTADTITVVYYRPPANGDVMASLAGNLDPPEAATETVNKVVEMLGHLASTYGRTVQVKSFQAKSAASDAVAARAEAQQVIDTYQPFASIGGPAQTPAYAEELAAQQVLCIGCGTSLADKAFQDNAPYLWGAQASPEQWLDIVSDYVGKRLAGRPARWAGDAALRSATRTFGVVNYEQDPPQFGAIGEAGDACESTTGWRTAVHETYLATNMADRVPTIIAKLKAEKVTTVLFMGDPIMPITLTKEATKQNYFPEWIVTGTVLTDTAVFGRRYDPQQWSHAFGLSQLAVSLPRDQTDVWRLHQWYYGTPPAAAKTAPVLWASLSLLFNGIHMAGPSLSAKTFAQGMFNLPVAGGGPTTPRISYGDRGTFPILDAQTCKTDKTRTDYLGTDDMVEVWWDPTVVGPDEQGTTDLTGKYRYANGGKRYLPNQMATTEADAFKVEGSVLDFKALPAADKAPDYPPPPR